MSAEGEPLMACLSSRQDAKLDNVKFFRGTDELISVARLTGEFCASLKRSRKHKKDVTPSFPKCKKEPVDVREFVANI